MVCLGEVMKPTEQQEAQKKKGKKQTDSLCKLHQRCIVLNDEGEMRCVHENNETMLTTLAVMAL